MREIHCLKGKNKTLVLEWLPDEDIAEEESEVQPPPAGQPPIPGLPVLDGHA